jgi:NADPH-dependent 2,4-dienoyl-CoA reductase/sulfur reductase-like enzyme
MHRRAVVVGASLAGLRAAESLRRGGHDGPLTILGAERHRPYDRPPLSKQILTGKAGPEQLALPVDDELEADWLLGMSAAGLDLDRGLVVVTGGDEVAFDQLVIATGAHPRTLLSARPGPGVFYLRTVEDALALRDELQHASRAVVIGAGFIGLEVAASARQIGAGVTVVEALPVPLERALGPQMGQTIAELHRRHDVDVRLGVGVEGLVGGSRAEGVRLADNTVVLADLVVVGIGVAPATSWLDGSGVDLSDGVLCDDRLHVLVDGRPHPDVVAAGDVCRWTHPRYGRTVRIEHWTNAAEQGEAAARSLLEGEAAPPYAPTPYFWSDQYGLKLQFVGDALPDDEVAVIEGNPAEDRFVATYGRDGRLVAALGLRRPARIMALQRMIAEGAAFPPEL